MAAVAKKRAPPYTPAELEFLKSIFSDCPEIHSRELGQSALRAKQRAWRTIEVEYNSVPAHSKRTLAQIKKFFDNMNQMERKQRKEQDRLLMENAMSDRSSSVGETRTEIYAEVSESPANDGAPAETVDRLSPFEYIEVSSFSEVGCKLSNLLLVEEIKKRPILYNFHLPGHSNAHETEMAWAEIGDILKLSGDECQKRWENIKSAFARHGTRRNNSFYLAKALEFALPYITKVDTHELPEGDIYYAVAGEEISEKPKIQRRKSKPFDDLRKRSSTNGAEEATLDSKKSRIDPVDVESKKEALKMFLHSMLPDLMEMDDREVRVFKKKSLDVVDDILSARSTRKSVD